MSLALAISQFNARAFFDCHETLELLWNNTTDPDERYFYQGILQIAVGFYHLLDKQNHHGAMTKMASGLQKFQLLVNPARFEKLIQMETLSRDTQIALKALEQLGPEQLAGFPDVFVPEIKTP